MVKAEGITNRVAEVDGIFNSIAETGGIARKSIENTVCGSAGMKTDSQGG